MGLRDDILKEPISTMPRRPLVLVKPETTVREAIQKMIDQSCGCVFVVNEQGKIDGKFSERMLVRLIAAGKPYLDDPVGKHSGEFWAVVRESDPIATVLHKLTEHRMHHLAVVDEQGLPISMVGQRSVMRYLASHFPRVVLAQLAESKLYIDQREGA